MYAMSWTYNADGLNERAHVGDRNREMGGCRINCDYVSSTLYTYVVKC